MKIIDVHTHIQDIRLCGQRDAVMRRGREAGVEKIICCGIHESDWDDVQEMVALYDSVVPYYGVHPWFVHTLTPGWDLRLEDLVQRCGAGVGEIGLDRMVRHRNDEKQEFVFKRQLEIAHTLKRPVSIHCRKAWAPMVDILKSLGGLPHGGVVHSWSGSSEMVKVFENLGASISFSGSVTKAQNKKVRKACKAVARARLLLETDSPDLLPAGVDAPLNEPAFIRNVLGSVAEIRGETVEAVADYTYANAVKLLQG